MFTGTALKEQKKYEAAWSIPEYRNTSPGEQFADFFMAVARSHGADFKEHNTVLDVGAGAGAGSRALKDRGFQVTAFDLTDSAWEHKDIPIFTGCVWRKFPIAGIYDHAYCCDVMEHIPTEFVSLSIDNIMSKCARAFFSVSFVHDHFGQEVGAPLHLTVKPFVWWRDCFRELATVLDARDLSGEGVFYLG